MFLFPSICHGKNVSATINLFIKTALLGTQENDDLYPNSPSKSVSLKVFMQKKFDNT